MKSKTFLILNIIFFAGIIIIASAFAIDYFIHPSTEIKKAEEKPKVQINLPDRQPNIEFVSGTEFSKDDIYGGTIIKLTDYKNDKINTTCWITILYPDKTTYISWTEMTPQLEFSNYYLNWTVPKEQEGIYDAEVRCLVSNKNISLGKGFHVNNEEKIGFEVI